MLSNFTFQDVFGIILAFSLYPLVLVFPGYVAGWALDLFGFRKRTSVAQLVMGIAFSSMISPALFFLSYRLVSSRFAIGLSIIMAILAVAIFILEIKKISSSLRMQELKGLL
jgi:MFS family permease